MTSIQTNHAAMAALQTLRRIGRSMHDTQQTVSSGLRIRTAEDNAAYWSISTTMRSDIASLSAVADALGLAAAKIDVASSGLDTVNGLLSEFKAKLVAASEDGMNKEKVQTELDQLKHAVRNTADAASFNGVNWLSTDIADIYDSDLERTPITASLSRSIGSLQMGTIDSHRSAVSLFNSTGGGLLEADARKSKTLGGIRLYDTYTDQDGIVHTSTSNTNSGTRAEKLYTFTGPMPAFGPTDTLTFDLTVDADTSNVPLPHDPGMTIAITIDRTTIDTAIGTGKNGEITTWTEYISVINQAFQNAGASQYAQAAATYHYELIDGNVVSVITENSIKLYTKEGSGLDGSSVGLSNFGGTISDTGGLNTGTVFGTRGSLLNLAFSPFIVHSDGENKDGVEISFSFGVNGASAAYSFNRTYVNEFLGKDTGKVETSAEMVAILQSLMGNDWPDVIIEEAGSNTISIRSDNTVDRKSGAKTFLGFTNINVNIDPLAEINFMDIDIVSNPDMLGIYLTYVDTMHGHVIDGAAYLGALQSRVTMQSDFTERLMDTMERGIGRLVDADLEESSTRLRALETQQQLALQSLSIANSAPESILSLFRA